MLIELTEHKKHMKEHKKEKKQLQDELMVLQQTIREHQLPVIILFEGWSFSGKGTFISELMIHFDFRHLTMHNITPPTDEEKRHPFLWRHWNMLPKKGEMSILDCSWYQDISAYPLLNQTDEDKIKERTKEILQFERTLHDAGYIIIKFFLQINEKTLKNRIDGLENNSATKWRVTEKEKKQYHQYHHFYKVYQDMLESTNTGIAPWHVVDASYLDEASAFIFETVINTIQSSASQLENKTWPILMPSDTYPTLKHEPIQTVPLGQKISDDDYDKQLKKLQKKLFDLQSRLYRKKIPALFLFEGWDAAGKGGCINRVCQSLDPRGYQVRQIAAPTEEERQYHYLWRFWRSIPKTGHITIFDRTWYGRVLVEYIEQFCTKEEQIRAYSEINELEKQLTNWGAVIVKFWLQIDKDEQLKRFNDRQSTPSKRWKITPEDWRNREKWDSYEIAVNQMLEHTSTEFAPWHVVPTQCKKYGRIQVLEHIIHAIEQKLQ